MSGTTERSVKYMAKSAAKNISSLESQTIIPTVVESGLFTAGRTGAEGDAATVDTTPLLPVLQAEFTLRTGCAAPFFYDA
jgi:hypothetical protein